jgi:hypothetical protein
MFSESTCAGTKMPVSVRTHENMNYYSSHSTHAATLEINMVLSAKVEETGQIFEICLVQVWDKALCDIASDGGECLTLVWELDDLRALGNAMTEFVKSQVNYTSIVTFACAAVLVTQNRQE